MKFIQEVFIGIDLGASRGNFTLAVLNARLGIQFCDVISPIEWQATVADSAKIIAAVNSPLTLNHGFMADPDYRSRLDPAPQRSRYQEMRVCEYQLICSGLSPVRTPQEVGRFSPKLQRAFRFASELGSLGFQFWPFPNSRYQMFETEADAVCWSVLGIKPFAQTSLEGRIQRQLLLQNKEVNVADAMEFFEEITRHRLLTGHLPDEKIFSASQLNALLAAYTAWTVANRPSEYAQIGEADEGILILPAKLPTFH
jgi:hypothetical protein